MPLNMTKKPPRVFGKVKFTCPVCDHEQMSEEISMPPRTVALTDVKLKSLVVINDPEAASGNAYGAEITYQCPKCSITSKQFFPITVA
jgi:rubredoxin